MKSASYTRTQDPVQWIMEKSGVDSLTAKAVHKAIIAYQKREKVTLPTALIPTIQKLNPSRAGSVRLYRGINVDEDASDARSSTRAKAFLRKAELGKTIQWSLGKPTSWTYSRRVAEQFGIAEGLFGSMFGGMAVVLETKVAAQDVLLDIRSLPIELQVYPRQFEVLLMPGKYPSKIVKLEEAAPNKASYEDVFLKRHITITTCRHYASWVCPIEMWMLRICMKG
jgi:hypothetical protein